MVKRTILIGLLLGILTTSTGCGVLRAIFCRPCGPCMPCDRGDCGTCCPSRCGGGCGECMDECGPTCDPTCQADCGPCDNACGNPCGEPYCGRPCGHRCGPLTWVFGVLDGVFCCHNGCGEVYWGEFHSDPPDYCDPCDRCGNYTGCGGGGCGCDAGYGGGGDGYGEMARTSRGNPSMVANSSARRTSGTNPNLPGGAQMISQSDRVVGPAVAPTQRQARRASVNPSRSLDDDERLRY